MTDLFGGQERMERALVLTPAVLEHHAQARAQMHYPATWRAAHANFDPPSSSRGDVDAEPLAKHSRSRRWP
jgi:hypothetical protein